MDTDEDLSDCLRAKHFPKVMVDKKHPATIRVLIDVVRAFGFSTLEAFVFNRSDPIVRSKIF